MKRKIAPPTPKAAAVVAFLVFAIIINVTNSMAQSGQKWATGGNSVSSGDFLGTTNNFPLVFKANNSEYLRITPNGFVGIGINNPLYKLDIGGRLHIAGNLLADSAINAKSLSVLQSINGNSLSITNEGAFGSLNVSGTSNFTGQLVAPNVTIAGKMNDGTHYLTIADIYYHANNAEIHRKINDAGTSDIDLWSASKIISEIAQAAHTISNEINTDDRNINILITPNPSSGIYSVKSISIDKSFSIHIYDAIGKLVYENNAAVQTATIDISKQPLGIYYLKVTTDNIDNFYKLILK